MEDEKYRTNTVSSTISKITDTYSRSSENPFPAPERFSKARTTVLLDYNMKDNYMRKENERK